MTKIALTPEQLEKLNKISGITPLDIEMAEDGAFFQKKRGLEIASVFHGKVVSVYNTSDDPEWPVWTTRMEDGTKLGYMFEDSYWEKTN